MSDPTTKSDGPKVEVKRTSFDGVKRVKYQGREVELQAVHAEGLRLAGYAGFVDPAVCVPVTEG